MLLNHKLAMKLVNGVLHLAVFVQALATERQAEDQNKEMKALAGLVLRDKFPKTDVEFLSLVSHKRKRVYSRRFAALDSQIELVFRLDDKGSFMLCSASVLVPDGRGSIELQGFHCHNDASFYDSNSSESPASVTSTSDRGTEEGNTLSQPVTTDVAPADQFTKDGVVNISYEGLDKFVPAEKAETREEDFSYQYLHDDSSDVFKCRHGSELTDGRCKACKNNHFYNSDSGTCQRCPHGYVTAWARATFCIHHKEAEAWEN